MEEMSHIPPNYEEHKEVNKENESAKKTFFDRIISPALQYVGMIGAVIMCVAYIALVIVLITGFEKSHDMTGDSICCS